MTTTGNDALIEKALEWGRDHGNTNPYSRLLFALVTRLQAAEKVCEAAEKIVPGCGAEDLVGLYKPIDDWRAARDGNGGEGK